MIIPNHNVLVISSVQYNLALSFHLLDRVFSKGRNYDIMVLSDLAKGGPESGVWIDEYNYKTKTMKSMSLLFFQCCVS